MTGKRFILVFTILFGFSKLAIGNPPEEDFRGPPDFVEPSDYWQMPDRFDDFTLDAEATYDDFFWQKEANESTGGNDYYIIGMWDEGGGETSFEISAFYVPSYNVYDPYIWFKIP